MASNRRRLIYNTRERLLSTDANDEQALQDSNLTNDTVALATGDEPFSFFPQSGVLSGGVVGQEGGNTINITAMRALKIETAPTSFDSPYLFLETSSETFVDLTSFVDGTNDRWVCIEVTPGDSLELASTRDIFQPLLSTFIPTNVDKIRQPDPVFTVNAGTPAVAPQLPLGTAGTIPLAYVYLESTTGLASGTDIIQCRPLMSSTRSIQTESIVDIAGGVGGVDVTVANAPNDITCLPVSFRWPERDRVPIGIPPGQTIEVTVDTAGAPNYITGDAIPLVDNAIHVYAMAAPYPSGYDLDVAGNREFVDLSGRIPSNVNGITNGIIFLSTGEPSVNPLGEHPIGAVSVNDPVWNSGTTLLNGYLGSFAFHTTNGATGSGVQTTHGDTVRINPGSDATQTMEDLDTQNNSSVASQAGDMRSISPLLLDGYSKGTNRILPNADEYDVRISAFSQHTAGTITQQMISTAEPRLTDNEGFWNLRHTFNVSDVSNDITGIQARIAIPQGGAFTWSHGATTAGDDTMYLAVIGYRDRILAKR